MPGFRIFYEGRDEPAFVSAETPGAAREAGRVEGFPIRKIKLDRETVDPKHRAPRLTLRELKGAPTC